IGPHESASRRIAFGWSRTTRWRVPRSAPWQPCLRDSRISGYDTTGIGGRRPGGVFHRGRAAAGHNELRRSQGSEIYAARSAGDAKRRAGSRRESMDQPAAAGDPRDVSLRGVWAQPRQAREAGFRSRFDGQGGARRESGAKAGDGVVRRQNGGPKMDILIYLPAGAKKPAPLFVGLGFLGNDSVSLDPGVKPGEEWAPDPVTKKMVKRVNAESARGAAAERWQLDMILARGYGLATINYADIEPDFDGGMPYGIR